MLIRNHREVIDMARLLDVVTEFESREIRTRKFVFVICKADNYLWSYSYLLLTICFSSRALICRTLYVLEDMTISVIRFE